MTYNDLLTEISDIRKISVAMKNSPVINTNLEMFGLYTEDMVRLIKKYKEIDLNSFELDKYYEINYIYIAIGLIQNKNIEKQYEFLLKNFSHIDSWAITDSTFKYLEFKKFEEQLVYVKKLIESKEEFLMRYGYLILFKYIKEENLKIIFNLLKNDEKYYVFMVEAWLIQAIFIHFPEETYDFLVKSNLSKKIKLKAISKICDSYQVSKEYKDRVKELRIAIKNQ